MSFLDHKIQPMGERSIVPPAATASQPDGTFRGVAHRAARLRNRVSGYVTGQVAHRYGTHINIS